MNIKATRLISLTFLSFCLAAGFSQAQSRRIGLSLPLSGANEKLAVQFLKGAQLAVNLHNTSHPIAIDVLPVDDGCSKEVAQLAADELLAAQPPINIVTGFLCNEAAYAAAGAFKDASLPILVAGAQSIRLSSDREREDWKVWRLSPSDKELAVKAAQILSNRWIGQPYAIVDDGTVHGRTLADEFRTAMEDAGLPPQFNDNFRPTQSTQARLVRRLRKAGVTNVFVGAAAEDITMIFKNSQELGIPLEIVGSDVMSILAYLPEDRRPSPGLLAVLEKVGSFNKHSIELTETLIANDVEPEPYIYRGFAAMQIAIDAIGDTHQDTISNLSLKNFETVLGSISFTQKGENALSPYALFQWNGVDFDQITE